MFNRIYWGKHDKIKTKEIEDNIDYSKLNKFVDDIIIQEHLSENKINSKDKIFKKLLEYEKEQLEKIIKDKYEDFKNFIYREKVNFN